VEEIEQVAELEKALVQPSAFDLAASIMCRTDFLDGVDCDSAMLQLHS
jgi:hypothetical protein